MRPIVTFTVTSPLPQRINRLADLYSNLYWSWCPDIRKCIRSVNPQAWHNTNHHPVRMLEATDTTELERLATDPIFLEQYDRAVAVLDEYMGSKGWHHTVRGDGESGTIAYFSAEFGLHESLPLYSGGLGVLSGDHTKSASDMALPFVCVGLMYQMGYFEQRLTLDGTQIEEYNLNDPTHLVLQEVLDQGGRPVRIVVEYPKGPVSARIWRLQVGRVPVYLLDTNIAENSIPEYRDIADKLYGGDQEVRIMQEIMLGIGGIRALEAIGISPAVTHSNEGHSAFLMLERTSSLMALHALSFAEASEVASAGSIFTTHTPVAAGNDAFSAALVEKYFASYWPRLGLSREGFLALGRIDPDNSTELFSMTVLALRMTSHRNGVSHLHGEVSRRMWGGLWPQLTPAEIPIAGITNGVHTLTWVADSMRRIFDTYLPNQWQDAIPEESTWQDVGSIPNAELWDAKKALRSSLVEYIHNRLEEQHAEWYSRGETGRAAARILDPQALTIGFARRFATYKRATLLFRDEERALRLFNDPERPIQMVIAGKAHPKDLPGKDFIRQVIAFIRKHSLEHRIVFVEDYDMGVARSITQGCDVWLNTPRRPQEASGTSGMKAAINGTINLSVLDGWFPEGYNGSNSVAIGEGTEFIDNERQDEYESRRLYSALERVIVPAFYTRDAAGIPHEWIGFMKEALRTLVWKFSSDRMVQDYARQFYFPSLDRYAHLSADNGAAARTLVEWKRRVAEQWKSVSFLDATAHTRNTMKVGQTANVVARIATPTLSPESIAVEACYGLIDAEGLVNNWTVAPLELANFADGIATYTGSVKINTAGHAGIAIRAWPSHPDLADIGEAGVMTWLGNK